MVAVFAPANTGISLSWSKPYNHGSVTHYYPTAIQMCSSMAAADARLLVVMGVLLISPSPTLAGMVLRSTPDTVDVSSIEASLADEASLSEPDDLLSESVDSADGKVRLRSESLADNEMPSSAGGTLKFKKVSKGLKRKEALAIHNGKNKATGIRGLMRLFVGDRSDAKAEEALPMQRVKVNLLGRRARTEL